MKPLGQRSTNFGKWRLSLGRGWCSKAGRTQRNAGFVVLGPPSPWAGLMLLVALVFSLATQMSVWREQSEHQRSRDGSVLETLMGDSRRLFANHFLTKADVYLHSGVYPSIFEQAQRAAGTTHLAKET